MFLRFAVNSKPCEQSSIEAAALARIFRALVADEETTN